MFFAFSLLWFFVTLKRIESLAVSSPYVGVGCYADKSNTSHPLPELLENFYFSMTWNTIEEVIENCSRLAQSRGHRYFGLQHYGECWSGKDSEVTYARDGSSENCVKGVGKDGANYVYKFVNSLDQSCDLGWHTANDMCFHISFNTSFNSQVQAAQYCTNYRGTFYLTKSGGDFVQDRLIKTLHLNDYLNTTNCLVLSQASVPYVGVLPTWNESRDPHLAGGLTGSSLGTNYECAVKDVYGKWYHHQCELQKCKVVCSKQRDLPATQGSFSMVHKDTTFNNSILMWQLVDDVTQCARECLVTDTCASFKYEYKSRVERVGSLCALSDRRISDSDLLQSDVYNYYERLR
ncbi:uncharacterized protein LOC116304378 [Actinia tenebrosa]|uniref:Uncharacterized protein LOC116304378 n=1 Tax=Actinia tenebrosa TaxID=6105 RepID=A0A6P8IST1_ACTTE|nr:uncharacterized protein LOC116304378 [Actinia tenebrosa]